MNRMYIRNRFNLTLLLSSLITIFNLTTAHTNSLTMYCKSYSTCLLRRVSMMMMNPSSSSLALSIDSPSIIRRRGYEHYHSRDSTTSLHACFIATTTTTTTSYYRSRPITTSLVTTLDSKRTSCKTTTMQASSRLFSSHVLSCNTNTSITMSSNTTNQQKQYVKNNLKRITQKFYFASPRQAKNTNTQNKNKNNIASSTNKTTTKVKMVDIPSFPSSSSFSSSQPTFSDPSFYAIPQPQDGDDILTDLPKNQRIVSFGDVHGDLDALYEFLQIAQVLHPDSTISNPIWGGGNSILVQCGDILDRGDQELACLRVLTSLARQAPQMGGGKVILLHGNHEALNAVGLFQYADPRGNDEIEFILGHAMDTTKNGIQQDPRWRLQYAGNIPTRWAAFEPSGWLSKPLYANMKVAVVVGKTLFVHAGLTAEHLIKYGGIEGMNQQCRQWFLTPLPEYLQNDDGKRFKSVEQIIQNAQIRAKTESKTMPECLGGGIGAKSPVWMRDYSSPADKPPSNPKAEEMIEECFKKLDNGVQRMVMGHTPQSRINVALNGKAWRVDVGASKGVMSGTPEVLEIIHAGGDNNEDIISILTNQGSKVPAAQRVIENSLPNYDDFL